MPPSIAQARLHINDDLCRSRPEIHQQPRLAPLELQREKVLDNDLVGVCLRDGPVVEQQSVGTLGHELELEV